MFDRIARVYDRMNSVMTAGMHHRWRERAADLARVGPGSRALDVATGTGDLAWSCAARGAEVVGTRLLRADARAGARQGARHPLRGTATRSTLPYADGEFDAVTVGFGARNFSDLARGLRRDGARHAARRARGRARDHHAAEAAAVLVLPALVRPRWCRASAGWPATPTPTPTCRARCAASPGPRRWPRELAAAGLTDVRWVLTAGGIIALHAGTRRVTTGPGTARGGAGRGRRRSSPRLLERTEARLAEVAGGHGAGARARHAGGTLAAGGKRLRPMLVFLCAAADDDDQPRGRRRRRWSCCTWPRSCTTTCSTARRCAAGARPCSPQAGRLAATRHRRPALLARLRRAGRRPGATRPCRRLSDASSALARGELMQRADAWSPDVTRRALPRALPAEDREPVRRLLPARRAVRRRRPSAADALGALRRAASAWPSSCSTTCSTCPARRSAPASRAAPTCSTAPSRCR